MKCCKTSPPCSPAWPKLTALPAAGSQPWASGPASRPHSAAPSSLPLPASPTACPEVLLNTLDPSLLWRWKRHPCFTTRYPGRLRGKRLRQDREDSGAGEKRSRLEIAQDIQNCCSGQEQRCRRDCHLPWQKRSFLCSSNSFLFPFLVSCDL